MRALGRVAADYGGESADGSFDLAGFAVRAFELAPTNDIDYLVNHGIDGGDFFLAELKPNWQGMTREQRAAKIASFVRFANLLSRNEGEPATDAEESERLAELRACVRTKIALLASAYDTEYDDSYCRRIARNLQRFGDYELSHA